MTTPPHGYFPQGPPPQGPPPQGPYGGAPGPYRPAQGPLGGFGASAPPGGFQQPPPGGPFPPGATPQGPFPTNPDQYGYAGQPHPSVPPAVPVAGLVAVLAVVIGLSVPEHGHNAWHTVHAWGALSIIGALLTLAPALARSMSMTPSRAWQLAVGGVGLMVLFWILLVLPSVGSNTSLLTTVGTAAGALAAWLAPTGAADAGFRGAPGGHQW